MGEATDVLVTWLDYDTDGPATGRRLDQAGLSVRLAPKLGTRKPAELARLVEGKVAAIVSTDPFDADVLGRARRLRVIARVGVGTDSIDLEAATRAGVIVTTTPGANTETTADHTLALLLAALRRLGEHDASVRRGEWRRGGSLTPWDLHGATVGLVGLGEIGRAVAKRLAGFGAHVLAADPGLDAAERDGVELVELSELLVRAAVVSLHLPLTPATRNVIGRPQLDLMPANAILVNTSRGGLVDEGALVEALTCGSLRAAALDVFADEPGVPRELLGLPNVTLTPHVAGLSEGSIARMTELATEGVLRALDGSLDPAWVANPEVLTGEVTA